MDAGDRTHLSDSNAILLEIKHRINSRGCNTIKIMPYDDRLEKLWQQLCCSKPPKGATYLEMPAKGRNRFFLASVIHLFILPAGPEMFLFMNCGLMNKHDDNKSWLVDERLTSRKLTEVVNTMLKVARWKKRS